MMHRYSYYLEKVGEIGEVTRVHYPLVTVEGLPYAKLQELVVFESGQIGQIFAIHQNTADIVLLSQVQVKVGESVVRTDMFPMVPVSYRLLGRAINPLGVDLITEEPFDGEEMRVIEESPAGIGSRTRIKRFLETGVAIIDMMVPLGKGQKELVIGDRKTGKSSFVLAAMKKQAKEGTILIYAAIGKKNSEIKALEEKIEKEIDNKQTILVATTSTDSPGLIYLTPFAAMTIAEYFRDNGHDVLLVLDDLSTHAKFYREISLVARGFPGRDSYPGDIFYTHARLLERAGNFKHTEKGEVAITCFPLTETIEGDITGFIPTNIMGITDGHIFFDSELFYKGKRPGINASVSVSRVGKQTQTSIARSITREINSFTALYEKVKNLSHFGSELSSEVKRTLDMGGRLDAFFSQSVSMIVPQDVQLLLFGLIWLDGKVGVEKDQIEMARLNLIEAHKDEKKRKFVQETLLNGETLNDLLNNITTHAVKVDELWRTK